MTSATPPANPQPCVWCGNLHAGACPRVSAIEYYEPAMIGAPSAIKRVEFVDPLLRDPAADLLRAPADLLRVPAGALTGENATGPGGAAHRGIAAERAAVERERADEQGERPWPPARVLP